MSQIKPIYIVQWSAPRHRRPSIEVFPTKSDAVRFAAALNSHPELPKGTKVEVAAVPFWHRGFPPRRGGTRKRKTSRRKK